MILELYVTFVALSLVVLALGIIFGENMFSFVGLFFLFLLGNSLLFNGIDYPSSDAINTSYNYVNGTIQSTASTVTYQYSNLDDDMTWWFGFLLALTSGFGLGYILFTTNQDFKKRYEKYREFGE